MVLLNDQQRQYLLRIARRAMEAALGMAPPTPPEPLLLEAPVGGAFVSLYNAACLRGCVGAFFETRDVGWLVHDAAMAVLRDQRFAAQPVVAQELSQLAIEISVLSCLEPAQEPLRLTPGVHGVRVEAFGRSGCFLPKVAVQYGWSADDLLCACCSMKLGLPADAWRHPGAQVFVFTAEVFQDAYGPLA